MPVDKNTLRVGGKYRALIGTEKTQVVLLQAIPNGYRVVDLSDGNIMEVEHSVFLEEEGFTSGKEVMPRSGYNSEIRVDKAAEKTAQVEEHEVDLPGSSLPPIQPKLGVTIPGKVVNQTPAASGGLAARLKQKEAAAAQQAKQAAVSNDGAGDTHGVIKGLAGCAKTTSLIGGMQTMKGDTPSNAKGEPITPSPQQQVIWNFMKRGKANSVRFCAFGNAIAAELQHRLDSTGLSKKGCEASTFHKLGYKAVIKAFKYMEPNRDRVKEIISQLFQKDIRDLRKERGSLLGATDHLVSLCKVNLLDGSPDDLDQLTSHFDIEMEDCDRAEIYNLVPAVLEKCKNPSGTIAFDDMIYLPNVHNLPLWKSDMLLVDECVPGWTPVMMWDGSSKTIEEIVSSDQEERVRSYDVKTSKAKNCRVIGKQRILNQKPLVQVKVKKHGGKTHETNFVVCTIDHKIWTINRGWVEAGKIVRGDKVILETAAHTSQKGKITKKGRDRLTILQKDNKRGVGNGNGTREEFTRIKRGNGTGPTLPEQILFEALGEGWQWGLPVATKRKEVDGARIPHHYKVDIAHPVKKIAVEIDGQSHRHETRQADDRRKEKVLELLGWKVIRVSNRDAVQKAPTIACQINGEENCPKPATVLEVSPTEIPDYYVYDITVEDCYNFYANGILVHNCQDLNKAQQALAYKAGHRIICVGDVNQAIFGFAGADAEAWENLAGYLRSTPRSLTEMALTVTRRCGKAIVEEARKIVPEFEAHPDNPEGEIKEAMYPLQKVAGKLTEVPWSKSYCSQVRNGDFILCRCNAPLVSNCFRFLKEGLKANILGRNIGEGLINLVKNMKANNVADLVGKVSDWLARECEKEEAKRFPSESKLIALNDKAACVIAFSEGCDTIDKIIEKINQIFTDTKGSGIILSSIHKAKGLEADRVFLLQPEGAEVCPSWIKKAWERVQSRNLLYVAVTRPKLVLTYVY